MRLRFFQVIAVDPAGGVDNMRMTPAAGPDRRLMKQVARGPCGGIGRRGRLKICCPYGRGSSSLPGGTTLAPDVAAGSSEFGFIALLSRRPLSCARHMSRSYPTRAQTTSAQAIASCLRSAKRTTHFERDVESITAWYATLERWEDEILSSSPMSEKGELNSTAFSGRVYRPWRMQNRT